MKRGEVWWVEFGAGKGGEIRKDRPAVIVSTDASNKHLNRVQIIPLTTHVEKIFPSEALVGVRGRQNKAMADQIATVSKHRLKRRVGKLSTSDMKAVDHIIMVQLGLWEII
ncbi:MAG: type II toxin-antitoxin system PemK/MazF family toxin [Planctomycetes bacterium]|nr:type II toxin-antitoxin system PemK/MazF family toxin [Planctomycetota bacterium]